MNTSSLCLCGCGREVKRKYISGHNSTRGYFEQREDGLYKLCGVCRKIKKISEEFYPRKDSKLGTNPCKSCMEDGRNRRANEIKKRDRSRRWRRFGMTDEDFNEMYSNQYGQCIICLTEIDKDKIVIDHDHKTNKVRGLLCSSCNLGLGHFRDDTESLERARLYLL